MQRAVDAELRERSVDVLEEPPSAAEEDRRQGDLELVHHPHAQILPDDVGAAGDAHVAAAGGLLRLREGAFGTVVDEVEGRSPGTDPRFALLVGEHEDRRMERRLLGPGDLPLFEHPLSHDAGAAPFHGVTEHVVHRTGLAPRTELQVLAEVLQLQHPAHQRPPFGSPLLVFRRGPMLQRHPLRRHVSVQTQSDVHEDLAQSESLFNLDGGAFYY